MITWPPSSRGRSRSGATPVALPAATEFSIPAEPEDYEALEGMLVTMPQSLAILETFEYARYGTIDVGVYDPTFYIAMDFAEDTQLSATGLPAGCRQAVLRPDEDELLAKGALTEDFFENPGATDIGKAFATRLELTCGSKEQPS